MAFEIPSREDIHRAFINDYAALQPDKNVSRGSDPYRLGRGISGIAWMILAKLLFLLRQLLPDTATGAFLERWGARILRLPRNGAAPSQGLDTLRVTGTPGSAVPLNEELAHDDGTLYHVATATVIGGGGDVLVSIASTSKGLQTNKLTDERLTFVNAPPGVNAEAVLVKDLTGGLDVEEDDDYRKRVLDLLADPPEGGAISDYRHWGRQVAGVLEVYVYPLRRARGTIDLVVLQKGTGEERIIADTNPVFLYIEPRRPADMYEWKILTVTPQTEDVTILIEIDPQSSFRWDWEDAGVGYAVTAKDEGAKTITVPTLPGTVQVGDRLTIQGEEATITAHVGDVLTLSFAEPATWFSFDPTGEDVRASGDLVTPVKEAILARCFNRIGPARGEAAGHTWEDSLVKARISGAAIDVDGVHDTDVTVPAANVVPVDDPELLSIPMIVPRYIRVWKKT